MGREGWRREHKERAAVGRDPGDRPGGVCDCRSGVGGRAGGGPGAEADGGGGRGGERGECEPHLERGGGGEQRGGRAGVGELLAVDGDAA